MARRARFPSSPSSIRFRPWIRQQVQRTARRSRRPFSEVVQDLLEEALRMRQCPGIYFADEPAGREAKVAGTGLSVWEVIRDYLAGGRGESKLWGALAHITRAHLTRALACYLCWPLELDE